MIYLIKHESGNYMDCDWKWKVVISESSKLHINVWVDLQNWIEQMEMVEKKEYGPLHSTGCTINYQWLRQKTQMEKTDLLRNF